MRTFDYQHLPQKLFGGAVGDANVRLYQDKGKLDVLESTHPELFASLEAAAIAENADASTRIEGLYVDKARVAELVAGAQGFGEAAESSDGGAAQPANEGVGESSDETSAEPAAKTAAQPSNETEAQIVGYANVLRLIGEEAGELPLSTSTVLKIYETMYGYRELGRKSRYRKKDYIYVQVDGHPQAMPVSPITAFETPLVLGGACDSLADSFDENRCSPLILASVFTVDFMCIRPFDEGNGRIARLFAQLMLEKAGFRVARYESIDRIIERSAMAYYDALNACVDGWDRGANDYAPFAAYWLDVVHQAYEALFEKVELRAGSVGKSERVRLYVKQAGDAVSKRQIREALPEVSEATIENALGKLVKSGEIEKLGAGRSTSYRWV